MDIAAQLWVFTKTEDLSTKMPAFLRTLADAGYAGIEGMYEYPPERPEPVEAARLSYVALHVGLSKLVESDGAIEFAQAMGAKSVVASGLLNWNEREPDDYRAGAEALNDLGARLRELGIELTYHNHEFEFEPVEGDALGMDLLLDGTDPEAVAFCPDLGWIWRAGYDPVAFMERCADRVRLVHLRDFRDETSVALGRGDMNQAPIIEALGKLPDLRAALVEEDPTTPDPLGDMLASREFIRERFGL